MDFSVADSADDGVLNLILWHATKGYETPYPRSNQRESLGKVHPSQKGLIENVH
jgi:hypothetical protein